MMRRFLLWIYRRIQQNPFNKREVTFTSQHERLKAKQFTNEGRMCLFQSSLFNKTLETTVLKQKRHKNQPHLARARRRGSQSFCTRKIAGASSGQLRMTITCAKIWRRLRRIIEQNASPLYAQTITLVQCLTTMYNQQATGDPRKDPYYKDPPCSRRSGFVQLINCLDILFSHYNMFFDGYLIQVGLVFFFLLSQGRFDPGYGAIRNTSWDDVQVWGWRGCRGHMFSFCNG